MNKLLKTVLILFVLIFNPIKLSACCSPYSDFKPETRCFSPVNNDPLLTPEALLYAGDQNALSVASEPIAKKAEPSDK